MDTETLELTKSDIAALRQADDVYAGFYDGKHYLRCVKRVPYGERETNPFADDKMIDVVVDGNIIVYGEHASTRPFAASACHASVWQSSGIWQILKPGDRIRLRWSRGGNSSESLRSIGWVGDNVTLEVIRKSDTFARRPLAFNLAAYAGPDNSARFVR